MPTWCLEYVEIGEENDDNRLGSITMFFILIIDHVVLN